MCVRAERQYARVASDLRSILAHPPVVAHLLQSHALNPDNAGEHHAGVLRDTGRLAGTLMESHVIPILGLLQVPKP